MLSEVTLEVALMAGGTPASGTGALGTWRASQRTHRLDAEPAKMVRTSLGVELEV